MLESRNSAEDPDTLQLSNLLNSLEGELETSYLERRQLQKLRKSTSLEELQDAVEQISHREKDLQACIGISKMLIETNEKLHIRNRELVHEKQKLEFQSKTYIQEIETYKEKLERSEERVLEINAALVKAEASYIKLSAESKANSEIVGKNSKVYSDIETISLDKYDADITEITERYKYEYEQVIRSKSKSEEKLKTTEEELEKVKFSLSSIESNYENLLKELNSYRKTSKKREEDLVLTQEQLQNLGLRFDELHTKHQELIDHSEKLAEEIELIQASQAYRQPEHHARENKSLKIELEDLEETLEDTFPEFSEPIKRTLSLRNSFRVGPRSLQITKSNEIHINSINIRKNPSEEYFFLTTQAIKLNSPYMDVICLESPKVLFDQAIKSNIPFHKWYEWIEKKLTAKYLESLYKKPEIKNKS
ncbi:hypothetical protein SteCoe_16182 [Stentor coeruleus]|uniref:Uncharacterized protein n=1 Tax=Stentor coeruleus TaxID=5963 RepID=A0A1R2C1W5_9CILI|nr:hypothetical protein SteCoe_16182 [Stentor coeruleus]